MEVAGTMGILRVCFLGVNIVPGLPKCLMLWPTSTPPPPLGASLRGTPLLFVLRADVLD